MHRVRRLLVWLIAVLWLPATLHCAMDRAGMFESSPVCCGHEDKNTAGADQCGERCTVLDGGMYKLANDLVKAPAPLLLTCLDCVVAEPREPRFIPRISPDTAESPPELPRTWQFTVRAALPPRAPSVVS